IRYDAPDRHRQRQFDHVARFPSSIQAHVALLEFDSHGFAVDLERDRLIDFVLEAVEIARDGFVARPAWDAHINHELRVLVRLYGHLDVAVPRVARLLNHLHRAAIVHLDFSRTAYEEIYVKRIALLRVDIAGHGSQETRDVSRTASHAEPGA